MNSSPAFWVGIRPEDYFQWSSGMYLLPPESKVDSLALEFQKLEEEHRVLRLKLEGCQLENQSLNQENTRLKQELQQNAKPAKRKYRKRQTTNNMKVFLCNVDLCPRRYSSRIALNSHRRKKHSDCSHALSPLSPPSSWWSMHFITVILLFGRALLFGRHWPCCFQPQPWRWPALENNYCEVC